MIPTPLQEGGSDWSMREDAGRGKGHSFGHAWPSDPGSLKTTSLKSLGNSFKTRSWPSNAPTEQWEMRGILGNLLVFFFFGSTFLSPSCWEFFLVDHDLLDKDSENIYFYSILPMTFPSISYESHHMIYDFSSCIQDFSQNSGSSSSTVVESLILTDFRSSCGEPPLQAQGSHTAALKDTH